MGFNYHGITTDNTKQIVHFVKELKYEDIPPVVIERAKMMVLHTVGVCLCSSELQEIKDAIEIAKEMSPGGEEIATIWADGKKVSWEAATFVAGTMGDMLDWEDCSVTGHPSAGIITTAVVAGEVLKKSGKDVLTAIVAGYEVYQRIALAGRTNIVSYNIFGNLTVLMKLLDLSEEKMNRAFGIGTACSIISCNVHEATMSDSLNYLYGFKNESTVTMIKTAMLGIENMEDAFDDGTAYLNHTVEPDITWLTKELGTEWFLMSMILVKHSPANVFVQTYAELAAISSTSTSSTPTMSRRSSSARPWPSVTGTPIGATSPSPRRSSPSRTAPRAPCITLSRARSGISPKRWSIRRSLR